jgi:haloalkane dehalogenase
VTEQTPAWLDRSMYPFEPRWFDSPHGRVHYLDDGVGDPVVMVHGNPTWSFQFREVIPRLEGRRAIAMDHLGFGLSDKPTDYSYLPVDQARNLGALLDSLDLHEVTLVVGDWGGPLGLSWALDHPDRVRGLVITNTWMWSVRDDWYYRGFSGFMGGPVGRRLIERRNFFAGGFLPQVYGDRSKLTPRIHEHYTAPLADPAARRGCAVLPKQIIDSSGWLASLWDRRDVLAGIPTALVWGRKDKAFRDKELRRWQSLFPQARVVTFADCGHFVAEEHPAELATEILALG